MVDITGVNPKDEVCAVIFGGAGFIGVFFAEFLLETMPLDRIYLVDLKKVSEIDSEFRKQQLKNPKIVNVEGDVREPLGWLKFSEKVSLVANFAAVHREPGHIDYEYYETNIKGAENVCSWVETTNCNTVVFSSSISPYGASEENRIETSTPVPNTAYGGSKLAAEKIHEIWQAKNNKYRKLVIVRPGVVFGPGEGGNVSRLIKAVLKGYFFYMGNKNTKKAGVYVKELCNAIWWVISTTGNEKKGVILFNMTMDPLPSVEDYVVEIKKIANVKKVTLSLPYSFLYLVSYLIEYILKPFRINHPFSPVRINKLVRSNNITPNYLIKNRYQFIYTLESALNDWKKINPSDWN